MCKEIDRGGIMNLKKSIIYLSMLTSLFAEKSLAGPFALFGSIQTTHTALLPTGGVRFSLNDNVCFDASLGAMAGYEDDDLNGITGYVDMFIYRQTIGVGVTLSKFGDRDLATTVGLLYALEKAITDKVTLGISPTIVSKTILDGYGVDFFSGFAVYTLISW